MTNKSDRWLGVGLCAVINGVLPAALWAAEDKSAEGKSSMEEVIVSSFQVKLPSLKDENDTGSRLGISALETPATVQTVTADMMQLRGDDNMVEAVSRSTGIASLPTPGSGGYGFAVRGFGSSSVTILYDGIKSLINTGSMTYPYDTWNVDRVDVLSGPASVLYGGGAIGAAINVLPRKPSEMAETSVRIGGGSFNTFHTALDTTGPITDQLLYRFDVSHNSSDGYVERGDSSDTTVTAALTYRATETLSFTLSSDYADREGAFYNGLPLINGVADESLRRVNYSTYDTELPFEDKRVTLSAEWQPSQNFKLRNVTYYIRGQRLWKYPSQFVYRPATNDILRRSFGTFTQYQNQTGNHAEAVWDHSLWALKNTLSFGFDVDNLSNKRLVNSYAGSDVVDLYNSSPGQFLNTAVTKNWQRSTANQYALFAEDRLVVLPALSLIAGLRVDHSAVDRKNLVDNTVVSKTYTPVSWRVGTVYEITPKFNLYGQYSTAVDPVGNLCCITAAQMAFALSEGNQIEVGLKNLVWDGRVEWSLAAYRIIKNKLLTPDPANLGQSLQVGQQSSRGVEAAVAWKPTEDLRIELNGTVLDAQYDDFYEVVSGVRVSREGKRPTNTPERLANLWVTWAFTEGLVAQGGLQYSGDKYVNTDNTRKLPAYTIADAGLRWLATKRMSFDLRVSNLFDKFYAFTSAADGSNGGQWLLGAPRSYEVSMTGRF